MFRKILTVLFLFSITQVSLAGIISYNAGDLRVELLYDNNTSGINTLLSSELDSMLITNTLTNEALVLLTSDDLIENSLTFEIGLLFNSVINVSGLLQAYRNDGYCIFCAINVVPVFASGLLGSYIDYWDAGVGLQVGSEPYFETMSTLYFASDFVWNPSANFNGITGADPRLQVSSASNTSTTNIPEPGILALMAFGLMSIFGLHRRASKALKA